MLYDVVLGGVLSATFIPVFVDRLASTKEEPEAFESISAVLTVSVWGAARDQRGGAARRALPLIDALIVLDTHAHPGHVPPSSWSERWPRPSFVGS